MADPKTSQGARMEREAFRKYLRRQRILAPAPDVGDAIDKILNWVNGRRKRYDGAAGGLGKK
jgi:hypothetical protein